MGWIKKKMYCDQKGIKYLHGVECYLTETLTEKKRDNYHTILIAKNYDGVKEINEAISRSCRNDHFYYTNRITFDEFLALSDNVIKTSACLASPLNKLDLNHPYYEKLVKHYDYLEIQPHNHPEQVAFNIHLATLGEKYHIPLIAGTDTHSLDQYKADCRKILLKAKKKSYGDEDSFDLTFKSYEELAESFRKQSALPESVYMEAISNTCRMAESVEEFNLDTSFKYPKLYGSSAKDHQKFLETIDRKFEEKIKDGIISKEQIPAFRAAIQEEVNVFDKIDMCGFMLSMSEIVSWCKENNIPIGPARGSVGGSRVAYITDITDLNPETWHTVFSRFCNENRKEIGDIDTDLIESDRPKVFQYIISRFGEEYTARVPTFVTAAEKDTIDLICRALSKYWKEEHPGEDNRCNPYSLTKAQQIKKDFELAPTDAREAYGDIFRYFDGIIRTKVAQSVHAAGIVISPVTLANHYGTFIKDNEICLMIDMEEIHEVSLVKYDLLVLNNIKIINDTCKLAGIPYPKSHEINWNDRDVWDDMMRSPVGVFQFEGEFAFSLLRQFKAKSIFDMSLVTAAIRPSGASYRNRLIRREPNRNPSPIIDELLKDNNGYLIYQEDTIKFLQEICGLSGSEADNVRRAIGRKDEERLRKALPQILKGYCNKSPQSHEVAEQEAKEFLQIIEDSASYQFGYNHSIAYCMIGYICAWLRKYYPYEFVTSYLDNAANDDDIKSGTELAALYGLNLTAPRFGVSRSGYMFDPKEKVIAKGIASIKYLNASVSEELYHLSEQKKYGFFTDLLLDISRKTSTNSRQLENLIKIDYFIVFGNSKELLRINDMFNLFKQGESKTIKKDRVENSVFKEAIIKFSTGKTKSGAEAKSYTIINMVALLHECETIIKSLKIDDFDYKNKMQNQLEILGYIDLTTNREEDKKKLLITEVFPLKAKDSGEIWAYRLCTRSVGSGKTARISVKNKVYEKRPIRKGDTVLVNDLWKNKQGYWYLLDWENIIK